MLSKDKDEVFGWLFQKAMRKVYISVVGWKTCSESRVCTYYLQAPLLTIVAEQISP